MTKEQAIELCRQVWGTSGLHNSLRVLHPAIGAIDGNMVGSTSYQTRQQVEWASLFRELAEALDPAAKRVQQTYDRKLSQVGFEEIVPGETP